MPGDLHDIRYELLESGTVARIVLDRPEVRNAQDRRLLTELDRAFTAAVRDEEVKVIVLAGDGPHFSSGHDLRDIPRFGEPGAADYLAFEEELYFRMCRRWHDLPKPTIAQVHGKTIAAGLMLMWVCDLIVASDDALFADPTVGFGVNGVEWFAHPWELGPRRAKELLFTGDFLTAEDARQAGMVNRVVPRDALETETLALAARIATKPGFALKLAKMAVNQTLDAQGFWTAQQAVFNLHHLAHGDIRERAAANEEET